MQGSPRRRRVAWAGILGLVSLRFPGAGSPRSLRGVMGERPLGKGLPVPPPRLRRATAVEGSARGLGLRDRRGDCRLGGGQGAWTGVPEGVGDQGGERTGDLGRCLR